MSLQEHQKCGHRVRLFLLCAPQSTSYQAHLLGHHPGPVNPALSGTCAAVRQGQVSPHPLFQSHLFSNAGVGRSLSSSQPLGGPTWLGLACCNVVQDKVTPGSKGCLVDPPFSVHDGSIAPACHIPTGWHSPARPMGSGPGLAAALKLALRRKHTLRCFRPGGGKALAGLFGTWNAISHKHHVIKSDMVHPCWPIRPDLPITQQTYICKEKQ